MKTKPAFPHREYAKLLMLAGVPIDTKDDTIMSVIDQLYDYEFNIHPKQYYQEVKDEIISDRNQAKMMKANIPIYEHNIHVRLQKDKQPIYIDPKVKEEIYSAKVAVDLMHIVHGISHKANKVTHGIMMIMNNQTYRQSLDVMLTKGIPIYLIPGYINNRQTPIFKVTEEQVRVYRHYIWNWTPQKTYEGIPLKELYAYINMNHNSRFYRIHRALLVLEDFDEILLFINSYNEEERKNINKKIYGLSSTKILKGLREDKNIKDYYIKAYMHADASIAEERRADGIEALREKMDNLFESVDVIAKKRKSIDNLIEEEEAYIDQGPMEPANIKRKMIQGNAERDKKN